MYDDDGRTDGRRLDGYTIRPPCEPNGSGELKITLFGFVSHGQIPWIAGKHLYFQYWSPSVTFCHCDVSADTPVKGTILTLTTLTLAVCNGETYSNKQIYTIFDEWKL